MQERHLDRKTYFEEQVHTTQKFVIPFIEEVLPLKSGLKVLEIGCGEGGNLVPFLKRDCQVTGVDISEGKIANAEKFLGSYQENAGLKLITRDIYDVGDDIGQDFDLIMMRDVIEHIHDQDRFMGFVKKFLKPDGIFLLIFPPWYNPFGGHQQISRNKFLSKLPYFHLLPPFLYKLVLRAGKEENFRIEHLMEIKETGISIERFRRIIRKHDYAVVKESPFLINPNYEVKFGLKPRKQYGIIFSIPFFRNFFTTSIYYLIRRKS